MSNMQNTVTSKLTAILGSKPFIEGFNDVNAGKPFDPSKYEGVYLPAARGRCKTLVNASLRYERGRAFGMLYKGQLKDGHKVTLEACLAYLDASNNREII